MVPWFFRWEPAAPRLLAGWFLGSSGWSQQPSSFYLDGSMVLKVGASGLQPFTWMVLWLFRLAPAASSFCLDGSLVLQVEVSSLQPFTWKVPWFLRLEPVASSLLPGWFLGYSGWSQRPPAFYLDGSLVLKVGASGHQPFTWMVPWFLRLEPAAISLLPGWFPGT
jgi:hypothetical protein